MRSAGVVVVGLMLLGMYVTWTAGRLDRLHARVDAAWGALDAQLVRRAAAARALVPQLPVDLASRLDRAAAAALEAGEDGRETIENDLSRTLRAVVPALPADTELAELHSAATRVGLARSFHNTAVQGTRAIRLRRLPRALRLAGHRSLPQYFEIDDTALPAARGSSPAPGASSPPGAPAALADLAHERPHQRPAAPRSSPNGG